MHVGSTDVAESCSVTSLPRLVSTCLVSSRAVELVRGLLYLRPPAHATFVTCKMADFPKQFVRLAALLSTIMSVACFTNAPLRNVMYLTG